jgi:hypothetical protein
MWRGRNYCLRSKNLYRNTYGVIDFRVSYTMLIAS